MSAFTAHTYVDRGGIMVTLNGDFSNVTNIQYKEVPNSFNNIDGKGEWIIAEYSGNNNSVNFTTKLISNEVMIRLYNGTTVLQEFNLFIMEIEEFNEVINDTVDTAGETGEVKKYYLAITNIGSGFSHILKIYRDIYDPRLDQGVQLPLQAKIIDSTNGEIVGLCTGWVYNPSGTFTVYTQTSGTYNRSYPNGIQVYKHYMSTKEYITDRKYLFVYTVAGETEVDTIIWNGSVFVDLLPPEEHWRRRNDYV